MSQFIPIRYNLGNDGFNYNTNQADMSPGSMVGESYNFNLLPQSIRTRGGTKVKLTLPSRAQVMALSPVVESEGIDVILSINKDGKVYKDSELIKELGPIVSANFLYWDESLILNTGTYIPQIWDPNDPDTTSDFPQNKMANDWILDGSYPTVMLSYGKGESNRAWAFGSPTRPTTLYYSKILEDEGVIPHIPDFNEDDAGFFYFGLPANEFITGIMDFGDHLLVFSQTKTFIIRNESEQTSTWSFTEAQWKGGTISQKTLVKHENDLISMASDGTAYSITAVMEYGDYKIASLTEAPAIDDYINDNIELAEFHNIHGLYDPNVRAIKFFCPSYGITYNNMALVYFVDKPILGGWSIHRNPDFQSGYDASCSITTKLNNQYVVLTGDYFGRIWIHEQESLLDDTEFYPLKITTPWVSGNEPRSIKRFQNGWLEIVNSSPMDINIEIRSDIKRTEHDVKVDVTPTDIGIYDISNWDECFYADVPRRNHYRYPIHRLAQSIQQVFTFIPKDAVNTARWDTAFYDDENALYAYDDLDYTPFEVLSNILDIKLIGARLKI